MRNRILAHSRNSIPYIKELRPIAQSAVGCLVMQQLDYWFDKHPDGFYKFLSPCAASRYRKGDSWTEEIGISADEFRTAFDKIGIRHKSKTAYEQSENPFVNEKGEERLYCSCTDKVQGVTQYFRNHTAADAALDRLIGGGGAIWGDGQSPVTEMSNGNSRKSGIPTSSDPSETTTKTTTVARDRAVRQKKPRPDPPEPPYHSREFLSALEDWITIYAAEYRHSIPNERLVKIYADLKEWGEAKAIEGLLVAARKGYRDVYFPDSSRPNGFNGNGKKDEYRGPVVMPPPDPELERIRLECRRCNGTGAERMFDENGKSLGSRVCKHQVLEEKNGTP